MFYFHLPQLDCLDAVESDLSVSESYIDNYMALLYMSGLVTIKKYDDDSGIYTLAVRNHELPSWFGTASAITSEFGLTRTTYSIYLY